MVNKVLISIFIFFFAGLFQNAAAQTVPLPSTGPIIPTTSPSTPQPTAASSASPAPSSTQEPDDTPRPSTASTSTPSPTVPVASATVAPSSVSTTAAPTSTTTSNPSPAVGGTDTEKDEQEKSSPTPAPAKSSTVQKAVSSPKPVLKEIADTAYYTAIDAPLAYFLNRETEQVYKPHGLSAMSTNILLSLSFTSLISGLYIARPNWFMRFINSLKNPPRFTSFGIFKARRSV